MKGGKEKLFKQTRTESGCTDSISGPLTVEHAFFRHCNGQFSSGEMEMRLGVERGEKRKEEKGKVLFHIPQSDDEGRLRGKHCLYEAGLSCDGALNHIFSLQTPFLQNSQFHLHLGHWPILTRLTLQHNVIIDSNCIQHHLHKSFSLNQFSTAQRQHNQEEIQSQMVPSEHSARSTLQTTRSLG